MPTTLGSLRRLVLTPSFKEVSFAHRGFPVVPTDATRRLEAIPQAVLVGFEWGIDTRTEADSSGGWSWWSPRCAASPMRARRWRSRCSTRWPAVVVAGPGAAVRRSRAAYVSDLHRHRICHGPAAAAAVEEHSAGSHRHAVLPDNELARRGRLRFRPGLLPDRTVGTRSSGSPYPWQGRADYFPRAFDQGIGRALWFIHGGHPAMSSPPSPLRLGPPGRPLERRGPGLRVRRRYDAAGLADMRLAAGEHWTHVAQGSVFAAKARVFSGFEPSHTAVAVTTLTDLTVAEAAVLADDVAVTSADDIATDLDYELWRSKIRDAVGARARSTR